jgi:hypothetical protein
MGLRSKKRVWIVPRVRAEKKKKLGDLGQRLLELNIERRSEGGGGSQHGMASLGVPVPEGVPVGTYEVLPPTRGAS